MYEKGVLFKIKQQIVFTFLICRISMTFTSRPVNSHCVTDTCHVITEEVYFRRFKSLCLIL